MAEWTIAAVLKTVKPQGFVGSNPTPSAIKKINQVFILNKKILILGANGFIGSSLSAHLLAKTEHEVYGIDISTHKLKPCLGHKRFHFTELDVTLHNEALEYYVKKCDIVFPLVAIATPGVYVTDPLAVFELDFESNLKVIRWCVRYKKRVIFPSTSEIYGMSPSEVFEEYSTDFVLGPISKQRWIYSCCKQLLDRIIYAYGVKENLDYTIFRPFNFIGPKLDDIRNTGGSRVVTQFLHDMLNNKPLQLVDGGRRKRCFTFINDSIECLLKIIENEKNVASQRIFNIGNPNENYSVAELAEEMVKIYKEFEPKLAERVKIESVNADKYYGESYQDVEKRIPSIREVQERLGWQPKTNLQDSLRAVFAYHLKGIDPDLELLSSKR